MTLDLKALATETLLNIGSTVAKAKYQNANEVIFKALQQAADAARKETLLSMADWCDIEAAIELNDNKNTQAGLALDRADEECRRRAAAIRARKKGGAGGGRGG